ncbi:MAG: hypothetical protein JW951_00430, partial [Lentisphaerae bacterium]|nr:hypothetical protein [Lentisphaerota bacterium]
MTAVKTSILLVASVVAACGAENTMETVAAQYAIGGNLGPASWQASGAPGAEGDEARALRLQAGGVSHIGSTYISIPDETRYLRVQASIKTRGIDDFDVSYNAALYASFHYPELDFIVRREMVGWANGTTDWTVLDRTIEVPAEMAERLRLVFELSKTRGGAAYLRDVRVDTAVPERRVPPVRLTLQTLRFSAAPVRFEGEDAGFVLSNLFGDRLDPAIGFTIDAASDASSVPEALNLETRILDHEGGVLWEASRPTRPDDRHVIAVPRDGAAGLPLDTYLVFEAKAVEDPGGTVLGSGRLPFGILSQDGDLDSVPVPGAVHRAAPGSPFGIYPCNSTIDRGLPDFMRKSYFTLRMSGADWRRFGHAWIQASPTGAVEAVASAEDGTDFLRTGPFNFLDLTWMARPCPEWWRVATGDLALFERYVRHAGAETPGRFRYVT